MVVYTILAHTLHADIVFQLHVVQLHTIISSLHVSHTSVQSNVQYITSHWFSHGDIQQSATVFLAKVEQPSHVYQEEQV